MQPSCQRPGGSRGVFVSITEQQTGPLEMKGSEWSQSKTDSAGDRYHTDSSSLRLGPRRINRPLIMDKEHTHTHRVGITICFIAPVCSLICMFLSDKSGLFTHWVWCVSTKDKNMCKQRQLRAHSQQRPSSTSQVLQINTEFKGPVHSSKKTNRECCAFLRSVEG